MKKKKNTVITTLGLLYILCGGILSVWEFTGKTYSDKIGDVFLICGAVYMTALCNTAIKEKDNTIIVMKIVMYIAVIVALICNSSLAINMFTVFVSIGEVISMINQIKNNKKLKGTEVEKYEIKNCTISNSMIEKQFIVNSKIENCTIIDCIIKDTEIRNGVSIK